MGLPPALLCIYQADTGSWPCGISNLNLPMEVAWELLVGDESNYRRFLSKTVSLALCRVHLSEKHVVDAKTLSLASLSRG